MGRRVVAYKVQFSTVCDGIVNGDASCRFTGAAGCLSLPAHRHPTGHKRKVKLGVAMTRLLAGLGVHLGSHLLWAMSQGTVNGG